MTQLSATGLLHRDCPGCGSSNAAVASLSYAPAEWPLKTCSRCGFVYLERAPDYTTLLDDFNWKEGLADEKQRRRREEPLLHKVQRPYKILRTRIIHRDKVKALCDRFVPAGPVLDVGCGSGKRMRDMEDRYVPHGVELLPAQAARAREAFTPRGGSVVCQNALAALGTFPADFFAGVLMISYLEHEVRPREVLAATHRVLQPTGRLIVKVPNYGCWNRSFRGRRWCGFRFPDHVNYFTPGSLQHLLEANGFRVVRFGALDRLPTSDTMWIVAEKC